MAVTIQTRRDDSVDWATANPVLALGEIGIETDTDKAKYGDGFTAWNDLEYWDLGAEPELPAGTNGQVLRYGASWEATSDVVIANNGRVGIGTTTPDYALVASGATNEAASIGVQQGVNAPAYIRQSSAGNLFIRSIETGAHIALSTENTERMRIDASGNLLVGRTSTINKGGMTNDFKSNTAGHANVLPKFNDFDEVYSTTNGGQLFAASNFDPANKPASENWWTVEARTVDTGTPYCTQIALSVSGAMWTRSNSNVPGGTWTTWVEK